jgi:hypothetical protein
MRLRSPLLAAAAVASALLVAVLQGCDDDGPGRVETEDRPAVAARTPRHLGDTLTIRGREVTLPTEATFANHKEECWTEELEATQPCIDGLKQISRGESYILYDPTGPRLVAHYIAPEDEEEFRPLADLIAGHFVDDAPGDDDGAPDAVEEEALESPGEES